MHLLGIYQWPVSLFCTIYHLKPFFSFGRKPTVLLSHSMYFIAGASTLFAPNIIVLAIVRFFVGCAHHTVSHLPFLIGWFKEVFHCCFTAFISGGVLWNIQPHSAPHDGDDELHLCLLNCALGCHGSAILEVSGRNCINTHPTSHCVLEVRLHGLQMPLGRQTMWSMTAWESHPYWFNSLESLILFEFQYPKMSLSKGKIT